MKNKFVAALAFTSFAASAFAAPLEFDSKTRRREQRHLQTDAPLESINGTATGISGNVTFDPDNPGAVKGKIVVQSASLHLGIRCRRNIYIATNGWTW